MIHTVIVPGVAGSETEHWQSWLQHQLSSCSRVQQNNWNHPVLNEWISEFITTIAPLTGDIQIVAHSFGCLTTIAALAQHSELNHKIKNLVLVAPANPARFGQNGFAHDSQDNYFDYFHQIQPKVPTTMLISENDPWLSFDDAKVLADAWHLQPINLGAVGHINVTSGFGPFPQIFDYLIAENTMPYINISDDDKYFFRFAI